MAIFLTPVTANAYTSTGADGAFQPTTSVILNSSQTVYNFTSIFIPTGVTVSFSGVASQPIEFLATGNIDIAGNIDLGGNSLLIDTGGSLSLPSTGSLIGTAGSSISLSAGLGVVPALIGVLNSNSSSISIINSGVISTPTSNSVSVSILNGGNISLSGAGTGIGILTSVPEPSEWLLMLSGIGLIGFFAVRRKNNSSNMLMAA